MTKVLLSVHVLAAVLAIGPVTVAASMFAPAARAALAAPGDTRAAGIVTTLHRICRVYSRLGILVPIFGLATAGSLGVLGDAWLVISVVLTAVAALLLVAVLLPAQGGLVTRIAGTAGDAPAPGADDIRAATVPIAMTAGFFSLLWAVVTVLMIVRPGSTTGA